MQLLRPPVFPDDEDKTYQAALVNLLLGNLVIIDLFGMFALTVVFPAKSATLGMLLLLLGVVLLAKYLLTQRQVRLANYVLLGSLWVLSLFLVLLAGGANSVNMVYFVTVVVIAGLLLGRREVIGVTVLTLAAVMAMVWLDSRGWMPARFFPTPPISGWFMLLFSLYMVVVSINLSLKIRERALEQARQELHSRVETTLALQQAEQRYRQAIEAAGAVPYYQSYSPVTFNFMGEGIFQLTGYTAREMTPAIWDSLVQQAIPHGEAEGLSERESIALARSGKIQRWLCDYLILTRHGQPRWIYDTAIEVLGPDGQSKASIGILQDITERKRIEMERERFISELEAKNAELERFTYTVSHDLEAPLITIQGFLPFVSKYAREGNFERLDADLGRISEAVKKMQRLLADLLDLSRIGRQVNPPQVVAFGDVVNDALQNVQGRLRQRNAQVVIVSGLPDVYGDRDRLVDVMQNLVDNAAKFMGDQPQPRIEIGSGPAVLPDGMNIPPDQVLLWVRDNGMGIAAQHHEFIFGLFNKLNPHADGTGVGLALVKRIIESHQGRIWVDSAGDRQGTTFYFTLPLPQDFHSGKLPFDP